MHIKYTQLFFTIGSVGYGSLIVFFLWSLLGSFTFANCYL